MTLLPPVPPSRTVVDREVVLETGDPFGRVWEKEVGRLPTMMSQDEPTSSYYTSLTWRRPGNFVNATGAPRRVQGSDTPYTQRYPWVLNRLPSRGPLPQG